MKKSNILIAGAGAVGEAIAKVLLSDQANDEWLERLIIADTDRSKVRKSATIPHAANVKLETVELNAKQKTPFKKFLMTHEVDLVVDCLPPYISDSAFTACFEAGVKYANLGTYSKPKDEPVYDSGIEEAYEIPMTSTNFSAYEEWKASGNMACICLGADPGMVNVFAKSAADFMFDELKEVHIIDGGDIEIPGQFGFNVWTVLDECTNPYVEYDRANGGLIARKQNLQPKMIEISGYPFGHMVHIEHEEVVTIPKYIPTVERATFSINLSEKLISSLITLKELGLLSTRQKKVDGQYIVPRNVVAAVAPQPTESIEGITGEVCVGAYCIGTNHDGKMREYFIYNTITQQFAMEKYGVQAVALQTAFGAAAGIECICRGFWNESGVFAPEYFEPSPYIEALKRYGIEGDISVPI